MACNVYLNVHHVQMVKKLCVKRPSRMLVDKIVCLSIVNYFPPSATRSLVTAYNYYNKLFDWLIEGFTNDIKPSPFVHPQWRIQASFHIIMRYCGFLWCRKISQNIHVYYSRLTQIYLRLFYYLVILQQQIWAHASSIVSHTLLYSRPWGSFTL